ncbi:hypothetical protein Tdes44962_MAKER09004 [Teratosphaeria destructans]|uniref:Uncharacterized protein n=1 Tax=Teratosphaeria destructans TaxID=418781 RepID=A0A9W7W3N7_9PEZI|nr:hypothetical protein Tdes44962_MAKER09004 [Teratosphaeria destructans]
MWHENVATGLRTSLGSMLRSSRSFIYTFPASISVAFIFIHTLPTPIVMLAHISALHPAPNMQAVRHQHRHREATDILLAQPPWPEHIDGMLIVVRVQQTSQDEA